MIRLLSKLTISRSVLSIFTLFISTLLIHYLIIAVAIGNSRSTAIQYPSGGDHRFTGIAKNGWTTEEAKFSEPRIYSWSSRSTLVFAPVRPQSAGPAEVTFDYNGVSYPLTISRDPITLTGTHANTDGIDLRIIVRNPFPSAVTPGALVGAKLTSFKLTPRFIALFPTVKAIGLTVLLLALLSVTLGWLSSAKRISLIPTAVLAVITLNWYGDALFDHWYRGAWLWGFLVFLTIGALFYRKEDSEIESAAIESPEKLNSFYLAFLTVIFLFALWVRISAVSFGLPQLYHPDESRKSKIALSMVQSGNLDPNYFRHPSFLLYSTALLGKVKQTLTGTQLEIPDIIPLGRSVSATLGALSVIFLFLIGRLLYGSVAGLIASATLAAAPLHVVCSRYIKEDVAMIFFALVSLYYALYYTLRNPRLVYWFIAALAAGFASSTKYTGVLSMCFAMIPLGVHLVVAGSRLFRLDGTALSKEIQSFPALQVKFSKTFLIALGLCVVSAIGFLVVTPYSVLNSAKFIKDFTYEKQHMNRGHAGAISAFAHFWTYHLRFSIVPSLTKPISIMALFALGFLLGRRKASDVLLAAGFLLFYLPAEFVNAKPFPQPERYILPCIPFMALGLGGFVQLSTSALLSVKSSIARHTLITLGVIALSMFPLTYSTKHRAHALNDTRARATQWVAANIPPGSRIISDWVFYSPYFPWGTYNVTELKTPVGSKLLNALSLEELQREKADYLIVSSFFYHRYLIQVRRGNKIGIGFKEIFDKVKPIAQFSDPKFAYGFHNPHIKILKIPRDP